MWWLAALVSCATEAPAPAPAPAAPAPAAEHDHAAHHAARGGHMEQMAKTRDALRAALGPAYDAPVPGLDAADATRGEAVYDQHCASCHGPEGKGDGPAGKALTPPPADFTDAFHARYYSDAGRVHLIRNGSPGTAMTGFAPALTDAQILDVYATVRAMRGDAPAAGEVDHSKHH